MTDDLGRLPAAPGYSAEPEPVPVSAGPASIPSAECPLCEGSGEAFMHENFRSCSLCEGEGEVPTRFAAYIEKMGAAQFNLYRQAEQDRELRARAEEAFDIVAPWLAKFAGAVEHYNQGALRYPGSIFRYDPCPSYETVLAPWAFGVVPGAPVNSPTVGDLRMLGEAYAQAIEARSGETRHGLDPKDESAVAKPCAQ